MIDNKIKHGNSNALILAIDQGTTGTTALLLNRGLKVLATHNIEFRQIYPKPGWVEHDLNEIWLSVGKAIRGVLKKRSVDPRKIAAIGIANQRETACFWSKKTGAPLAHAIVWQDRRTTSLCETLKSDSYEPLIQKKTGLVIDPYFSGSKVAWALENSPRVRQAARKGDCAFGTVDSYLVHRLTDGKAHVTEPSNASRTLLFNIKTLQWDEDLLKLFKIPRHLLPEVLDSTACFGVTRKAPGLPDGIPIHGMLGDQQAALLGQGCVREGMAKCTYGTGSFILANTGFKIPRSNHRLLGTVAWRIGGKTHYALEGGSFTAGASIQWMRDGLGIIEKPEDIEKLARTVPSTDGVVFVPAFAGLSAPHWLPEARGAFFGLTRGSTKAHMARAILEGIALLNHDILKAMERDMKAPIRSLGVDGGASRNDLLMQFQADVLGVRLARPRAVEATALGAAFAAGLGIGLWKDLAEIEKSLAIDKEFKPRMTKARRELALRGWSEALARLSRIR